MGKYIIDTDEWANLFEVRKVGVYGIGNDPFTNEKTVWSRMFRLDELEEFNSDYINENIESLQDESYQRGYNDAAKAIAFDEQSIADKALEDAWDAAKKLALGSGCGGMGMSAIREIFDGIYPSDVFMNYTAKEAIDKIKAYEHERSDPIKVGDKVIVPSDSHVEPGELLSIVNGVCYIMWEDKTVSAYRIDGVRCVK